MQNLTARYNVLFNAREILKQKQAVYATGFIDNYNEILSVYQDTSAASGDDKELDAAIEKANYIITFKEQSNYLDDAYLVLGKANYLKKNYFNALEYFSYILRTDITDTAITQETRVWKARTLLKLKQLPEANALLDTALQNINPKKSITADVYATKLQYAIDVQEYADAEEMAKLAIEKANTTMQKLRWTFILGQLQELNLKNDEAILSYTRVVKSNAPFEMAFNADLNRIRVEDMRDGVKISRTERLARLLKNDNNTDFADQIYYQIAQLKLVEGDIDQAIDNYKLSTKRSTNNSIQKGMSYLRLADIYFKNKADYVNAKHYYDSTLINLPPTYPGYGMLQKKNENLKVLTDNLSTISREDTLQMLAKLNEKERLIMVDSMAKKRERTIAAQANAGSETIALAPIDHGLANNTMPIKTSGNSFYFNSNAAIGQGVGVFKRKWGNRRLEDNWRRSKRAESNITANTAPGTDISSIPGATQRVEETTDANVYKEELLQNIPLTAEQLSRSNQNIFEAYLNIANFYRDVVEDKKEAIAIYELLLKRFPDNPDKAAIYYSLYRLHDGDNTGKAAEYKNILLTGFANTPYAKVILDPEYAKHLNDSDNEFNGLYSKIYDLYTQRKYTESMEQAASLLQQYPDNKLAAQLYYLKALARGRQVKIDPFKEDIVAIASKYPDDRLVTPLIKQHLAYIDSNKVEMAARRFAILDSDPNYIPFMVEDVAPLASNFAQVADKKVEKSKPAEIPKKVPENTKKPVEVATKEPIKEANPPVTITEAPVPPTPTPTDSKADSIPTPAKLKKTYIFNEDDHTNYYFVVNVNTNKINLASSRFGIGQFNRSRYRGVDIKHQLKGLGINQLIYVGRFNSLGEAKVYAREIVPLMPEIMKVPQDKYTFFIITQQNLDKLADNKLLDSYFEYYQDNLE